MTAIVQASNLTKIFNRTERAVDHMSFGVEDREIVYKKLYRE